ncbi:MAG: bifunctional metallophosphatase/5'-nucleotidase [Alistipes sp.]|nr:bifunctional metallophosphatase/5'-nucleotidase [Alistipes sp.]
MKKGQYSGTLGSFIMFGWLMYIMLSPSEFVILSTNDMHASLDNAPRLATAIKKCRDTVFTIVADAGDRWTGNAYVDLAENRLPIIRVLNELGYNVATLGNHEFDPGQQTLSASIDYAKFDIVCANLKCEDSRFAKLGISSRVVTPEGIAVDFVGVVTSFSNGHPDGNAENFEGMIFENPLDAAEREGKSLNSDVKVLLSHMGDDRDMELAGRYNGYDIIIGGHTHRILDTLVNGTTIGQTGRKLKNIGVTKVKMRGKKITSIEYENIPLANYEKDEATVKLIDEIESNPALKVVVGSLSNDVNRIGLGNLRTEIMRKAVKADIGIYHRGGIRMAEMEKGDVTTKMLFDNEPFFSQVHTIKMTPAQLRNLIITKYNDTVNAKESHRVDLYASTPYNIIVDQNNEAYDVEFPQLKEGHLYKIAIADYVARTYKAFEGEEEVRTPLLVYDLDVAHFKKHSPLKVSNEPKQKIVVRKR